MSRQCVPSVERVATRVVAKICTPVFVRVISRASCWRVPPRAIDRSCATTMAAAPADDITAALETVETRTRAAIDALRGLEAIAQSNDPDNAAIPQCLQSVVDSFEQIRACEVSVGGVQVPRDVVESVDQGRNPDAFLAELAERNAAAGRAPACHAYVQALLGVPSSAPAPAQGAPGGSGQPCAPRKYAGPLHARPSQPPPLTVQAPPSARRVRWRRSLARCSSARRRAGCSTPCRGGHKCACVTVARTSIALSQ